jgi:hypothetical protein
MQARTGTRMKGANGIDRAIKMPSHCHTETEPLCVLAMVPLPADRKCTVEDFKQKGREAHGSQKNPAQYHQEKVEEDRAEIIFARLVFACERPNDIHYQVHQRN